MTLVTAALAALMFLLTIGSAGSSLLLHQHDGAGIHWHRSPEGSHDHPHPELPHPNESDDPSDEGDEPRLIFVFCPPAIAVPPASGSPSTDPPSNDSATERLYHPSLSAGAGLDGTLGHRVRAGPPGCRRLRPASLPFLPPLLI